MNLIGRTVIGQRNLTEAELDELGLDTRLQRSALVLDNGHILFPSASPTGGRLGYLAVLSDGEPEILVSEDS